LPSLSAVFFSVVIYSWCGVPSYPIASQKQNIPTAPVFLILKFSVVGFSGMTGRFAEAVIGVN
jgi:hypothetical protein